MDVGQFLLFLVCGIEKPILQNFHQNFGNCIEFIAELDLQRLPKANNLFQY
jgi:hypothetical protein